MQISFRPCKKLEFIEWIMKKDKKYFYVLSDSETWIKVAQTQYLKKITTAENDPMTLTHTK